MQLNPTEKQLVIFYSGSTSGRSLPEQALIDTPPSIMLTFWEIDGRRSDTARRFERHAARRAAETTPKKRKQK